MKKWETPSISELDINETACNEWDWFWNPCKPVKPGKPHRPGKPEKPGKPDCGDDGNIGGDDFTELFS